MSVQCESSFKCDGPNRISRKVGRKFVAALNANRIRRQNQLNTNVTRFMNKNGCIRNEFVCRVQKTYTIRCIGACLRVHTRIG